VPTAMQQQQVVEDAQGKRTKNKNHSNKLECNHAVKQISASVGDGR